MRVEYLGSGEKEDIERRVQKVATAGRLSRTSGKAYEVYEKSSNLGYEKNVKYAKRVIGMGHGSIAEHDYIALSIDDVSPILEHILIGSRLSSFTIKSRREVDFRNNGFYIPEFRDKDGNIHPKNDELKEIYKNHMQNLFDEYGNLIDNGMRLEDARYILPYCFYSNLVMGMDAREFTRLTRYLLYGKVSNIEEARALGEKFLEIIDEYIPYMSDVVRENPKNGEDNLSFLDEYSVTPDNRDIEIHDKVKLTSYTPDSDRLILISALQQRYQISHDKALELLDKLSQEDTEFEDKLMRAIVSNDEKRELEQVSFSFDIPIPLAVRTHLERHRMHSLLVPDFVPLWNLENYDIPPTLKKEQKDAYDRIFQKNREVRDYFINQGVNENDLVYFYQAANKCNVLTTINGSSLAWISRMRCCNKAQAAIRKIVNEMCDEVRPISPLYGSYLGASCDVFGYCPEGKESCGKILVKRKKEGSANDGK